jgi:UDP-N-acetylglucosamine--N-acetylmuramyl-(pentapeptide) pyrophosphoryl-undecaprenol N-acetylglucosamine transferase
VLARAGGSVFELAAAGRPAILVPYPHATASHQDLNAAWMERAGAAEVLPDQRLSAESLRERVADLLGDPERLAAMAAASAGLAMPDAARRIAGELLEAAASR